MRIITGDVYARLTHGPHGERGEMSRGQTGYLAGLFGFAPRGEEESCFATESKQTNKQKQTDRHTYAGSCGTSGA